MENKTLNVSGGEKNEKKKSIHSDHRERMRQKLKKAPHSLTDFEIVEMLLYLSLSRGNTNEQAHRLLDAGNMSLRGLLELDDAKIASIDGLGEKTGAAIAVLREFCLRLEKEKLDVKNEKKVTKANITQKLHKLFLGKNEEEMIMITTDASCTILGIHTIANGSDSAMMVPVKKVVKAAIDDKAAYVIFAHNHPNGILVPSDADISTTKTLCEALAMIDVAVIEHYIVTETSILGIMSVN